MYARHGMLRTANGTKSKIDAEEYRRKYEEDKRLEDKRVEDGAALKIEMIKCAETYNKANNVRFWQSGVSAEDAGKNPMRICRHNPTSKHYKKP